MYMPISSRFGISKVYGTTGAPDFGIKRHLRGTFLWSQEVGENCMDRYHAICPPLYENISGNKLYGGQVG